MGLARFKCITKRKLILGTLHYWRDFCLKKGASKIYDATMQVLPSPTAAATDVATITARLPP
jgi:hypothetical protein